MDKTFLRFIGSPQQGWIYMGSNQMTHGDFLLKLTHAKAAMTEVTLIPGETSYGFSEQLSKDLKDYRFHHMFPDFSDENNNVLPFARGGIDTRNLDKYRNKN